MSGFSEGNLACKPLWEVRPSLAARVAFLASSCPQLVSAIAMQLGSEGDLGVLTEILGSFNDV